MGVGLFEVLHQGRVLRGEGGAVMAGRIRSIKPEILEDEKTAALSHMEWRLFVSIWLIADDHGNLRGDPTYVLGQCLWASGESPETVEKALENLRKVSLVAGYEVRGQSYLHIINWDRHQKISHKGKARMPLPSDAEHLTSGEPKNDQSTSDYPQAPETLRNSSGDPPEGLRPDLRSPTSDQREGGARELYDPNRSDHRRRLAESTWARMDKARQAVAAEVGLAPPAPFPKITPSSHPGSFRDLSMRIVEESDVAPQVCQRILEHLIAQARTDRSLEWLSEKAFTEGGWRTARNKIPAWRAPDAPIAAPKKRVAYVGGREVALDD
jgi:hypothetical protein